MKPTLKPKLSINSDNDPFLQSLITCISGIECVDFFSSHLGMSQIDQRQIVDKFQSFVVSTLISKIQTVDWSTEYCPSFKNRDSIDIFGKGTGFVVVIELDKNRADQVAKKFVSRMALYPSTKVFFVSGV